MILDAYRDYRGALKQAEVMALEVLKQARAEARRREGRSGRAAPRPSPSFQGTEPAERAKLELIRDEQLRRTQDEDKRYQIAKDLSDNLTISYNTSEVIMARLMQTTNAKERVYAQAVTFFSTNDCVLTALKASFTGMFGLHESTQTLDAMKEGMSQEPRSAGRDRRPGGRGGRARRLRPDDPRRRGEEARRLGDHLPGALLEIIAEMRKLATQNSAEIRDAVEDGKRRIARLVAQGQALPLNG